MIVKEKVIIMLKKKMVMKMPRIMSKKMGTGPDHDYGMIINHDNYYNKQNDDHDNNYNLIAE